MLLGENNDNAEHIDIVHSDHFHDDLMNVHNGDLKKDKEQYRPGRKGCCCDCYARLYAYPRLRIFLSFLYLLVSLLLVVGDICGALWIGNEIWTFKFPFANTDHHELWFGILMVLLSAPFLILWAAHLIFIEETIFKTKSNDSKFMKWCIRYPLMFLYVITPIGVIFLLFMSFVIFIYGRCWNYFFIDFYVRNQVIK